MARKSSPYSHFMLLYQRGYLRDQIVRIMHVEGYKTPTKEIREWFKAAPKSARVERRNNRAIERKMGINDKDRFWGYLYRLQSQIDPALAAAAQAWKANYP